MALTLVATVGSSAANSYATEAEATAYFAGRPGSTAWMEAWTDDRDAALVGATSRLEQEDYRGARVDGVQALKWPRVGVILDGLDVAATTIPVPVKRALFEEAFALLLDPARLDDSGLEGFESVDVGPVSVTLRGGRSPGRLTSVAMRLLAPVLAGSGAGSFTVVRG